MDFDKPFAGLNLGNNSDLQAQEDSITEQLLIVEELPKLPVEIYKWHGDSEAKAHNKPKDTEHQKIQATQSKETKDKTLIQPVRITGLNKTSNSQSFITVASEKTTKEIEHRAAELLRPTKYPYKKRPWLLSDAEKTFYNYMVDNLKYDIKIMVKVRLADIVDVNEAKTRDSGALYKIACKHLDYVITDSKLDIICAVELDDYTHATKKAHERDRFVKEVLQECGVPFFRVGTKVRNLTTDDLKYIEMCILEYFAPICPACGRPMELQICHRRNRYGHKFYGCLGYYEHGKNRCGYTIDID